MFKPFEFTYIRRGAPLNDILWYLTTPPKENEFVGTTISCSSALNLDDARRDAQQIVDAITETMRGKRNG